MAVYFPILGVTIKIAVGHQYGINETSGQAADIKPLVFTFCPKLMKTEGVPGKCSVLGIKESSWYSYGKQ